MKEVVDLKECCLDREQRNLLSVAYKNVIGAPRASWRILTTLENSAREDDTQHKEQKVEVAEKYRKQVEEELNDICKEVLSVVEKLITGAVDDESKVFYYKMQVCLNLKLHICTYYYFLVYIIISDLIIMACTSQGHGI